ncbi:MAG TPA: hypothetical protein ENK17_06165, partial [Anaerolineae bacterium]|nr:hypothetical protein [Anaerolineae bacterium]
EPDAVYGLEIPAGQTVSYLTLDDVRVVGADGDAIESELGFKVDTTASLFHLTVTDSSFENCDIGWYFAKHGDWGPGGSQVRYITVTRTIFRDNDYKGIYVEKLSDALFEDCTVTHNGYTDFWNSRWNAGFDINLKGEETYQNLTFRDMTFTDNGLGYQEGVGLMIKGRDDGPTYGAHPATLMTVTIEGGRFVGNERGIRFGEPGKENATPTGVQIHHAVITGNVQTYAGSDGSGYGGVVNHTLSPIDATLNDWGVYDLPSIEAQIYHQADDSTTAEVVYYEIALASDKSSLLANGIASATVTGTLSGLLYPAGQVISFTTNLGTLSAVTGTTDVSGSVAVFITSTVAGQATVVGTAGMGGNHLQQDTVPIAFTTPGLDHFHFYLLQNQVAGEGFPVAISARDADDVILTRFDGAAILTDTTGTLQPAGAIQFHHGVWNGHLTVTQAYVGDVLTATYVLDGDKTGFSQPFDVAHNLPVTLSLTPPTAAITAGERVTYTVVATDGYSNSWDATADALFLIEDGAGGAWTGSVYTAQYSGTWQITATVDGVSQTAALHVERGPLAGI